MLLPRPYLESFTVLVEAKSYIAITRDKGFDAPEGVKIFHNPEVALKKHVL